MACVHVKGRGFSGIITMADEILKIDVGRPGAPKIIHFEMHSYFGPLVCNKDGSVSKRELGPKHPFWNAIAKWEEQGKRVESGVAVWDH